MGFGVPLADWFRGSLRAMLWDRLTSQRFLGRGLVSPEFVRALLEEHDGRRRNNETWLWSLLVLDLWFEHVESAQAVRTLQSLPDIS
jgi:asparagine synthase (glutamine-hydrolysing)